MFFTIIYNIVVGGYVHASAADQVIHGRLTREKKHNLVGYKYKRLQDATRVDIDHKHWYGRAAMYSYLLLHASVVHVAVGLSSRLR